MPGAGAAVAPRRVVVLGIGNTLLADEGVGVHAALALQQDWRLPDGVEVIDGGTAGMELLGPLAGADLLLVLDAVKSGRPPATMVMLEGDEVPAFFRAKLSQHQVSICDVLAGLEFEGAAPRVPWPVRQKRCLSRASSSRGWNGARQKSSKRSSRSSRSASWAPVTSSSSGSRGRSPLRRLRHSANAPSGSVSAQITAPAHPSSGASARAASSDATAFQG